MNERGPKFPPPLDDDLALANLAQWVAYYGGYDPITAPAWPEWDRLASAHAETRRAGRPAIVMYCGTSFE